MPFFVNRRKERRVPCVRAPSHSAPRDLPPETAVAESRAFESKRLNALHPVRSGSTFERTLKRSAPHGRHIKRRLARFLLYYSTRTACFLAVRVMIVVHQALRPVNAPFFSSVAWIFFTSACFTPVWSALATATATPAASPSVVTMGMMR